MAEDTSTPLHIGIIPDGNRRWARQHSWQVQRGHEQGLTACRDLITFARQDARIGTLTLWGFSTENWQRHDREVAALMSMYEQFLLEERHKLTEERIRFIHSGRDDRIPASLLTLMQEISEETASFTDFTLNFAIDHGGRDELIRAIRKLPNVGVVTEETLVAQLDHPELPDIDLVVRTSGEQRLSGFFLWQAAFAELYFTEILFPDFKPENLQQALAEFERRQRRFGA